MSHLFSTFPLQNVANRLHEKQRVGLARRMTRHVAGSLPFVMAGLPPTRANISTYNRFCCPAQSHFLAWAKGSIFLSYKRSLDVDGRVTLFPGKTFLHWTMSIESIIKLFEINNILILFRHISFESIWLLNQKLKSPACYSNTMRNLWTSRLGRLIVQWLCSLLCQIVTALKFKFNNILSR